MKKVEKCLEFGGPLLASLLLALMPMACGSGGGGGGKGGPGLENGGGDGGETAACCLCDGGGAAGCCLAHGDGGPQTGGDGGTTALGDGGLNAPPVARCGSDREVHPLDTLILDGRNSSDPEGGPLTYRWRILERPSGSTAPIREPGQALTSFFVDLATPGGEPYRIELCVTDRQGASDCCTFAVHAAPCCAIHVQLVWDKERVDVDLHVLSLGQSENAAFFDLLGSDCYYMNKSPSWAAPGSEDDPSLDIDDVDGYGPENINIGAPAGGRYVVAAHYFCDDALGPTRATLRIFCQGQLCYEKTRPLEKSGDFWTAAIIDWPGCAIEELNCYSRVPEGCMGWEEDGGLDTGIGPGGSTYLP